jgi:hypothetical protein
MNGSLSDLDRPGQLALEHTTRWRAATGALTVAVALSAALPVAAVIDQTGQHRLTDHGEAMYAAYGKEPDPALLYGLLYTVAVVGAALWLLVLRAVRSRRRSAPVLAGVSIVTTAGLAVLLLASTEYGEQIFPPVWGTLAGLPPAAGVLATVLLLRRR